MEKGVGLMLLKDNQRRALKGFIESEIIDSKKLYIITGAILLGYLILTAVIDVILLSTVQRSSSNGGALTMGFATVAITMFISAIVVSVGKEVKSAFVFPIDRKTYVFGNFIMFTLNTFGLLLLSSIAFLFEFTIFKILSRIFGNFIYINSVTLESFLVGFWVSFCYILFLTTFTYFIFNLFVKYRLPAVIIVVLGINLPFYFSFSRKYLYHLLVFFTGEQSVILLSIKLIVCAAVFQLLSYLTLRNREVIK
jgi:hypothetical protein